MIDIVYTHRFDPRSGNKQLIYSLRSVEKYLKDYRNIYIIGHNPELKGLIHIPATDLKSAATNIKDKLLLACSTPEISDDFLYMADDHYQLTQQDAETYPNYTDGTLRTLAAHQNNTYKQFVLNTASLLEKSNQTIRNFNVHCPIIYNKEKLIKVISLYKWNPLGYVLKSLYGNTMNLPSVELKDLKMSRDFPISDIRQKINGRPVFSSGKENKMAHLSKLMDELYPDKSKYE